MGSHRKRGGVRCVVAWLALALALAPGSGLAASGPGVQSAEVGPNGFRLSGLRVPRHEIRSGGPPRDGIRGIDAPGFASADQATWVTARDPVIGVALAGDARAYPVHVMERHQLVNDRVGDTPLVVTYDPLAAAPVAWERRVGDRVLTFGVSGLLYNANFLLYDRETESLWVQFTGEAVAGPLSGERLRRVRVRQEPLGRWLVRHRATRVLALPEPESEERRIDYSHSPYRRYWIQNRIPFPVQAEDRRFHAKELVVGVAADGRSRAYLGSVVTAAGGRVEDRLGEYAIEIDYDSEAGSYRFEAPPQVEVTEAYWFAWKAFHPGTEVWRDPGELPDLPQD